MAELEKLGVAATYTVFDVTNPDQVESLADFAWDWKGHADVVINNAGIMVHHAPVLDMQVEDFERIFAVNFYSVV